MHREATLVRVERFQRGGAADVRDPRARPDRARDLGDRPIGDAQKDELTALGEHGDAPLAQARSESLTGAPSADDGDRSNQTRSSSEGGYRAAPRS